MTSVLAALSCESIAWTAFTSPRRVDARRHLPFKHLTDDMRRKCHRRTDVDGSSRQAAMNLLYLTGTIVI